MSAPHSATEQKRLIATAIRALTQNTASGESLAQPDMLAELITSYSDFQLGVWIVKILEGVNASVANKVEERLTRATLEPWINETFMAAVKASSPALVKSCAETTIRAVPISTVKPELEPFLKDKTLGDVIALLLKENATLKEELSLTREYVLATRSMLGQFVQLVSKDGGEVKIYTTAKDGYEFFTRRPDIEKQMDPPISPGAKWDMTGLCGVCAKPAGKKCCAGVLYCGRECQRYDWQVHKKTCVRK